MDAAAAATAEKVATSILRMHREPLQAAALSMELEQFQKSDAAWEPARLLL
jgi:hypothetical protein